METVLYNFCSNVPIHILAYYPFWRSLRFSKRMVVFLVGINIVLHLTLMGWVAQNDQMLGIRWAEFSTAPVSILLYFLNVRGNRFKQLFVYLFATNYIMVCRGVVAHIATYLFHTTEYSLQGCVCIIVCYTITLPWILRFYEKNRALLHYVDAGTFWKLIWLMPGLNTLAVLLYSNAFGEGRQSDGSFLLSRICLFCSMLVICNVLLKILREVEYNQVLIEQGNQMNRVIRVQRKNYHQLQGYIEESRRIRHDLRQHLQVISQYAQSQNLEGLQTYLKQYSETITVKEVSQYCKNLVANALLSYYHSQMEENHIRFEVEATLTEHLVITDPELCTVLGNLLENALSACKDQSDVQVHALLNQQGNGALTIIIANTASKPPIYDVNGMLLSSKHAGLGIGTQLVRNVAKKYHGIAQFDWKDGVFSASVFMYDLRTTDEKK